MAGQDKLGEVPALQISRCHLETGRKRYRLLRHERIRYEELPNAAQGEDPQDDDAQNDDSFNWEWFDDMMEVEGGAFDEQSEDQSEQSDHVAWHHHPAEDPSSSLPDDMAPSTEHNVDIDPQTTFLFLSDDESNDDDDSQELMSDDDDFDMNFGASDPLPQNVPQFAEWRLNLTALSWKYNLYFAAYCDEIHVSRPRSCTTHDLPSKPDLVLKPPRSSAARGIMGTINPLRSHQVNHLIVGDFGTQEILLMAYDNGDVIAYYTREIEVEIVSIEAYRMIPGYVVRTKPFFQENVGKSAWGLAIHTKSRLIAVGSNLHEAIVFAPALSSESSEPHVLPGSFWQSIRRSLDSKGLQIPEALQSLSSISASQVLKQRTYNWKITLNTAPAGDNIPNLTFSNDKNGFAEKVIAVDIQGNLWLMDIWSLDVSFQKIPSLYRRHPRNEPFLPSNGFDSTFGLDDKDTREYEHPSIGRWWDVSKAIVSIPQNALYYPRSGGVRRRTPAEIRACNKNLERDKEELKRLIDSDSWFRPYGPDQKLDSKTVANTQTLADGSNILRLYETGIELRPHTKMQRGIMMQYAMNQMHPTAANSVNFTFDQHNRLAHYHFIPELSLVVAGSMSGRVALITLTAWTGRDDSTGKIWEQRGFKVERILPLKKDEEDRLRPICPLFGVAVGPLPVGGYSQSDTPSMSRQYRIMIQYYDHSILSYEISRGMESEVLTVT
ncbi:hypothetical protein G7054_g3381 [Neopestalotiopsis clavispora]|nr:hypothetical protein G7054_g3381 [Neopestalotiopsis clavispora]